MASQATDTTRALSNLAGNHAHLRQKRARSQLSCVPCRTGKLKCNRSQDPACDQCVKRNREGACTYVPPPVKSKPAQNVKGRIRQLESLVVDLMNQQQMTTQKGGANNSNPTATAATATSDPQRRLSDHTPSSSAERGRVGPIAHPTPPSDCDSLPQFGSASNCAASEEGSNDEVETTTKPFGQMRISKGEVSYVGEAHWHAILNSIDELKAEVFEDDDNDSLDTDSDNAADELHANGHHNGASAHGLHAANGTSSSSGPPQPTTGLGFMIGHSQSMSKDQLIAAVPEKKVADRLLSLWFNSPDPFKPIIHAPTFQEEYRQFWRNPRQMPTMWLGLLFSIMSLATSFGLRDIDPASEQAKKILSDVNRYHSCAGAAAVLADFTKPRQYTIECLILYSAGLRSSNAFVNVWLMIGTVVRLCLRMGYHRDPGNYPAISPFHGEMRRRVWAIISMIDVLISFQLGLPSLVKTVQSDTQMPRNLYDRDFGTGSKELPPNRSNDELTPCSYIRAKLRIIRIFADATELSHATIPPAHEEMMELDRRLEDARAQIPPVLQMPDISEVVTDPAEQLMCRFNLDLIYLKTKTVLHRRYMERPFAQLTPEEQRSGIGMSRKTCTDSALRVLQHHHTIYTCSQPGGQLESVKWYMGSISTHDFLLAAMVICLDLSQQMNSESAPTQAMQSSNTRRTAMLDALQRSQKIWADASGRKRKVAMYVGKDELNKGEHMFDETERASRVMAAMLARVKAYQRAHPENYRATPSPAPFATPEDMPSIGSCGTTPPMQYMDTQGMDFGGIVSYHPWGDLSGMHDGGLHSYPNGNMPPPLYGSDTYSHPTTASSNNASPDHRGSQPDITMISDMLDVQGPVDWSMWDDVVQKTHKQQWRAGGLSYDVDMSNPDVPPTAAGLGLATTTNGLREPVIIASTEVGDHSAGNLPIGARALGAAGGGAGPGPGPGGPLPPSAPGPVGEGNDFQPWMHSFEHMETYDMDRVLGFPKAHFWPGSQPHSQAHTPLQQQSPSGWRVAERR